jgi:hypothetical protein
VCLLTLVPSAVSGRRKLVLLPGEVARSVRGDDCLEAAAEQLIRYWQRIPANHDFPPPGPGRALHPEERANKRTAHTDLWDHTHFCPDCLVSCVTNLPRHAVRGRPGAARSGPDASTRQRDSPGGSTAPALSSRPVRCPADAPDSPRPQCSRPFKTMPKHHLGGKL